MSGRRLLQAPGLSLEQLQRSARAIHRDVYLSRRVLEELHSSAQVLPGKKVALGVGAFFGEMALLGNNLRSADITTTRVSQLLVLDLVDFRLLMARHPDIAETIEAEAKRRAQENK